MQCLSNVGSVWYCWSLSYAVKLYYCWTWLSFMCIKLEWAKLTTLFTMHNRLSVCGEFCSVHSWQNGTRCRDGVKVLWHHSHLVWLVFEASIPTCTCFQKTLFLFPHSKAMQSHLQFMQMKWQIPRPLISRNIGKGIGSGQRFVSRNASRNMHGRVKGEVQFAPPIFCWIKATQMLPNQPPSQAFPACL